MYIECKQRNTRSGVLYVFKFKDEADFKDYIRGLRNFLGIWKDDDTENWSPESTTNMRMSILRCQELCSQMKWLSLLKFLHSV
jgi:hypothetical protein